MGMDYDDEVTARLEQRFPIGLCAGDVLLVMLALCRTTKRSSSPDCRTSLDRDVRGNRLKAIQATLSAGVPRELLEVQVELDLGATVALG